MPENLTPKPLSKRALSGRSIGNAPSPSRPPIRSSSEPSRPQPPLTVFGGSRTRPPPINTLQTPLLSRYGLVVNTEFRILICLECQGIVDPAKVRPHFVNHHKNQSPPLDLQTKFDTEALVSYPNLTSSPPHPTEPVDEIYGLNDPVNTAAALKVTTGYSHVLSDSSTIERALVPGTASVLRKERWIERVQGFSNEALVHIASYTTRDTAYGGLHVHVYNFLSSTQASLDEPYIRRSIGTRPADEHDHSTVRFHRDINKPSLEKYARIIAAMISFLHRTILNIDTPYTFPITSEITGACNALIDTISTPTGNDGVDGIDLEDAQFDGDENSEVSQSSEGEEPPPSTPPLNVHPITPLQPQLTTLLYLLFTQLPTNDLRGQFFTPIYHFLVLSSLRKNGEWAAANAITHTIAAILFTGRLVFAWKTLQLAQELDIDYSSAFAMVSSYFDEKTGAVIPRLYVTKRGFTGLHSAEESTFFFNAPDSSGTAAIIDHRTLSLSQIKSTHLRAMDEIDQELDDLTFNSSHCIIPKDAFIHDSPRERSPGFSFLKHPKNPWNHQITLVQHIMQTDFLFSRYAYVTATGAIAWNSSAVADQMKRIYDLQMKILCNIILSYGEPARGTELASHLLANVSGGSIRNFFVLFNIPLLRASFNKTTGESGDKAIYRIPLPRLGSQFVRFLAYLRPLFVEWQGYLNPFMLHNAQHFLFPGFHRPLTAIDVSKRLAGYTLRELQIPLRLRRYRQFMAFITSCNQDVFEAAASTSTATHEQFGHTAKINLQHYGQDSRTPDGLNFSSFKSAARVSGVFHLLYGHSPELLEKLEYGQGRISTIKDTINRIRNRSVPTLPASTISTALELQDITTSLKQLILPEIASTVIKSTAQCYASVIDFLAPKSTSHTPEFLATRTEVQPHPFFLAKLRELNPELHGSNGAFKTLQQAQATQLLYERKENVVYIAPTGSGKTMPNTLCTKYFDEGRCTIWILPLVALHEQHRHTSRRFGLTSESWTIQTSSTTPPANVLATIDQVTYDSFRRFISRLIQQDLLARINIDEAHLILTHASFRPVMNLLQWIASSPVQIVLTTATLPPSLESSLLSATGITSSVTLRAMTPRPNVSIHVVRAQTTLEESVEDEFRKGLAYSSQSRVLLFCQTKREVQAYTKSLNVPYCNSDLDSAQISAVLDRFRNDDDCRGLVATSILGVGLDVPNVSHVVHANLPRDVISYIQEAGRAGRASSQARAFSIVVLPPSLSIPTPPQEDLFGNQVIREAFLDGISCRRLAIQTFVDGVAETCAMLPGLTHVCDNCERAAQFPPSRSGHEAHRSLVAAHSRIVYPPIQAFELDDTSMQLEMAYRILNHYNTSCISCALKQQPKETSHLFRDCESLGDAQTKCAEFQKGITFLKGNCYQCGIPQKTRNSESMRNHPRKCPGGTPQTAATLSHDGTSPSLEAAAVDDASGSSPDTPLPPLTTSSSTSSSPLFDSVQLLTPATSVITGTIHSSSPCDLSASTRSRAQLNVSPLMNKSASSTVPLAELPPALLFSESTSHDHLGGPPLAPSSLLSEINSSLSLSSTSTLSVNVVSSYSSAIFPSTSLLPPAAPPTIPILSSSSGPDPTLIPVPAMSTVLAMQLKSLLGDLKGACVFCWLAQRPLSHNIWDCSHNMVRKLATGSDDRYRDFRDSIHCPVPNAHCYGCYIPQNTVYPTPRGGVRQFHPRHYGRNFCPWRDTVLPVSYLLFFSPTLRQYLNSFSVPSIDFETVTQEGFTTWLVSHHSVNALPPPLFLMYAMMTRVGKPPARAPSTAEDPFA
ncbi:hypothetical protein AGABI1DRAFT_129306 [Agaricus bisporus var. burnettii JB137-S8]|uniref:DNA 3'-5' helicase n=1 Tax=Agaricus bisporus var. burnettii (strain JB137-S8 / ATCC MYA-4627 / FGSC 10392) TaxID=597362 RepID=K5VX51_AGABU|nr:uncharacterized protein AGABI1DRAFT_129306 [Agaricus bisporus var. burnettii JB137-S8]EKM79049.1 hypothetical protein AGABI1DRAFT_129306 [Agaricus bisporus var. burnettii JB137-S8]